MRTPNNPETTPSSPTQTVESATQRLDRLTHAAVAPLTELAALAARLGQDTLRTQRTAPDDAGSADDDPRFRHEAWATWPFSQIRTGFRNTEAFWREAAYVPGMTAHHADMTQFFTRQWLGMLTPANWLATNPVVLKDVVESNGTHLLQGAQNWLRDAAGLQLSSEPAPQDHFRVGRDVAVTPGKVIYRNALIELIRYDAQTDKVHPEPVLIIPSWIMKYYILDLSPHNSMVRYLVEQGHTVYMLSWRNPDAQDHDLTMDDYLRLGVIDALHAVGECSGTRHGVHTMGYCLGGTLLAIAVALGRRGGMSDHPHMPTIKTMTLLAAQTDFSEPGELGLFIDESQVGFLDQITRGKGYLSGDQMAWNADTTRMPARMHHEYLTSLYLHNALASSTYRVRGRAVSLSDIHLPVFLVGTQRDHVSPWQSVYKLHHLCNAEITFVLTSGGHNAGIISEPGHAHRSYQMNIRPAHSAWIEPTQWAQQTPVQEGSWWPAWHQWLGVRSGRKVPVRSLPAEAAICDAPGSYVMQRYQD